MKSQAYFLLITLLAVSLCKISYSQNTEVPFALSPFIGDTLDLAERNYYGLYWDFNGFQRAVHFDSEDGSAVLTKILYSPEGREIDTLVKLNASYKGNLLALIRRVDIERMSNWEGAREITLTDINGNKYTGSFFDLEKDRLYMTSGQLNDYSQVINNYRIFNKEDIKSILFKWERNLGSSIGNGFIIGAIIGALVGAITNKKNEDKRGWFSSRPNFISGEEGAVLGGAIIFGAIGGAIGLIYSLSKSASDEMITINRDEDFYGLAKYLKNQNINSQISLSD